jgi:hypothetical protein
MKEVRAPQAEHSLEELRAEEKSKDSRKIKEYEKFKLVAVIITTAAGLAMFTYSILSPNFGELGKFLLPLLSAFLGGGLGYLSGKVKENK